MTIEIRENEALVNVTHAGFNGDLSSPVPREASDASILAWVTEAVRSGTLPGIPQNRTADFTGFVVDRFDPTAERSWALYTVRPKTPFGLSDRRLLQMK